MMNPNKVFGAHEKIFLEHLKIRLCSNENRNKFQRKLEKFLKGF